MSGMFQTPEGQEMVKTFLTSPEGQNMMMNFISTPQGKQFLSNVLLSILDTVNVPHLKRKAQSESLQSNICRELLHNHNNILSDGFLY
ncbi:MAG: hypothetical protein ABR887_05855 [Methanoregulaceae archaeon]|jgi:hypothetical protein